MNSCEKFHIWLIIKDLMKLPRETNSRAELSTPVKEVFTWAAVGWRGLWACWPPRRCRAERCPSRSSPPLPTWRSPPSAAGRVWTPPGGRSRNCDTAAWGCRAPSVGWWPAPPPPPPSPYHDVYPQCSAGCWTAVRALWPATERKNYMNQRCSSLF